jgi:large subunit ribosomal protein L25
MPSDEITLTAESGRTTGSRASKRLRAEGKIPGVVYGHGSDPRSVTVGRRDLRAALTTDAGMNALINLDVEGENVLTIVRDIQRDAVRREVTHVDFILVNRDEVVTVEVPIVLEGESKEVNDENGTIDQQAFTLTVNAKPGSIPNEITLDVSGMGIGDTLRVGDVELPSGVSTDVDPEEAIAVAMVTRATIEAEAEDAAADAADEAAAAGEAAPAADDAGE